MTDEEKTYLTLLGHSSAGIQIIKVRMKMDRKTMQEVLNDMDEEWIEVSYLNGNRKYVSSN